MIVIVILKGNVDRVLVRKPEGRRLEDLGVDGRAMFKWMIKRGWVGVDWICLALYADRW